MKAWLRKLRGSVGVGLTWGIGWGAIMAIIGAVIGVADPAAIDPGEEPWRMGLIVGTVGFFSGLAFSAVFATAERRRPLTGLSLGRAAVWGAIGGAALPLLTGMNDTIAFNYGPAWRAVLHRDGRHRPPRRHQGRGRTRDADGRC